MKIAWKSILPNGGRVFIGGGACVPFALVDDLLAQADSFRDVEINHIHTLGKTPWISAEYEGSFRTNSFFLSSNMSEAVQAGRADYTPSPMSEIPRLFETKLLPIDVALIQCTLPNEKGMVSLGLSVDVVLSAVESAKVVVAQINPKMPYTHGSAEVSLSKIDHYIEHEADLPALDHWSYDDRHEKIGKYAAQLIEDGSTIQASMGNSPQAVLNALHSHKNLGIHSGLFSNAMMRLMKSGAVDNLKKSRQTGVSVVSHCLGSNELYDFVNHSKEIELRDSAWCNDPVRIARHNNMVAINGASELDLTGQVVRDSRGHHFYGGIGATQDFIRGAAHSKGGRPIIALTSLTDDGLGSRIVTGLSPGSGVCTSRGDTHYVVTEYGIANLVGQSIRQRVLQLVEVAHPNYREALLEGARLQGWIPKTFNISYKSLQRESEEINSRRVSFKGINYTLRPIAPSDMRAIQELFYDLDEETIRLRYGYARPELDAQSAYKTAAIDQSKDLALGVFYRNGLREELRATGRFYRDADPTSAEISFLVHEKVRRRGMANFLLTEIAKVAEERGIESFWASVLRDNGSMAGLFTARGAKRKRDAEDDSDYFSMNVSSLASYKYVKSKEKISTHSQPVKVKSKSVDLGLGIYMSKRHLDHDTGSNHPESAERYKKLMTAIKRAGLESLQIFERKATVSELLLAHSAYYHDMTKYEIENFAEQLSTGDTAVSDASYEVAAHASGGALNAVDAIMSDRVSRAFCAVRPPGHHATEHKGMGFCIFNHVAVAARYIQKKHKLKRVAILDWDVHHGNGTQDIFYEDPSVFYFSTHEAGIFPNTGQPNEKGKGKAKGTTLNIPLAAGTTDIELLETWENKLLPALKAFKPQFIIISAGFDAAAEDPLADFEITPEGFAKLTTLVRGASEKLCKGRLLSVLEGGYDPKSLAKCAVAHLKALE